MSRSTKESSFCVKKEVELSVELEQEEDVVGEELQMEVRRPERKNKGQPAVRYHEYEFAEVAHFAYNVNQIEEPKTLGEALSIASIQRNGRTRLTQSTVH